ncbi:MAG: class I SAM-dependent methyltransferase [Bryobacteraceae bacterium]
MLKGDGSAELLHLKMSWDVERYEARHSYVWNFGANLIETLDPKPGERILDLGCGGGHLADRISSSGATVIGVDSSPAMIAQARINFPRLRFLLSDGASFSLDEPVDAVFSNAALHWMKPPEPIAVAIARALRPGGRLVAEFGGKGNIRAVLDGLAGIFEGVRDHWYFPSIAEYAALLERHGLIVTFAALFERPTPLEGDDGMEDWMEMFCGTFFDGVPPPRRSETRHRIAETLRPRLYRNGKWIADYRRLRVIAVKEPVEPPRY